MFFLGLGMGLGHYGPLGIFEALVWRLFVPHQVRVDLHSAGDPSGSSLFLGWKCQVECQIYVGMGQHLLIPFLGEWTAILMFTRGTRFWHTAMSDWMSLGDHSKTVLYAFFSHGGVSNRYTGCHGLQRPALIKYSKPRQKTSKDLIWFTQKRPEKTTFD